MSIFTSRQSYKKSKNDLTITQNNKQDERENRRRQITKKPLHH
jgi:hypothetical protein